MECEEDTCLLCAGSGTMSWQQPVPGPEGLVLHEMSHPCPRGCSGWWRLPHGESKGIVAGNVARANEIPAGPSTRA
ncbi:hypothetical protein GCM10011609_30060 [Lentzea pudingi]|uniref:Uncharacterized protein n=1 Tax=Lentzea pudingi TaxID=1789439 RepID=A0ABQ2HVJ7_9PSEU|nr:hypothetical protein GCM10011609_30060 [Lentzea pudingi]